MTRSDCGEIARQPMTMPKVSSRPIRWIGKSRNASSTNSTCRNACLRTSAKKFDPRHRCRASWLLACWPVKTGRGYAARIDTNVPRRYPDLTPEQPHEIDLTRAETRLRGLGYVFRDLRVIVEDLNPTRMVRAAAGPAHLVVVSARMDRRALSPDLDGPDRGFR